MECFHFRWNAADIDAGAGWIALGLFFKCRLADNLGTVFNPSLASNPFAVWINNLIFGLRIYYDFGGYSMIALGLARCLGVRLTLNFVSPYCSLSVTEFWRRWHITLSQWFRDYLYIPLGGGRVNFWACNILLVFIVSGLWHGAGWGFLLWGAFHGLFLIINRVFKSIVKLPKIVCWFLTMTGAFFAWLCFYETRPDMLFLKIKTLLTPAAYNVVALREAFALWKGNQIYLGMMLSIAGIVLILEWLSLARYNEPYAILRRPVVVVFW